MPTRTRVRPQRDEVRARIIAAAEEEFSTRGFAATTMRGVAQRAGYTKGAVYSNFESKAELFVSLIVERFTRVLDAQVAGVVEDHAVPDEAEHAGWARVLAQRLALLTERDAAWHVLIMELAILATYDEQAAVLYRRSRELVRAMVAVAVETTIGPDRAVGGSMRYDVVSGLVISTVNMIALEATVDPDRYTYELRVCMFEAVLRGSLLV